MNVIFIGNYTNFLASSKFMLRKRSLLGGTKFFLSQYLVKNKKIVALTGKNTANTGKLENTRIFIKAKWLQIKDYGRYYTFVAFLHLRLPMSIQ